MKNMIAVCSLLSLAIVVSLGCGDSTTSELGATVNKALYKSAPLCAGCGEIKGSAACCAEGAEKCAGCSFSKGSPGCCKMKEGVQLTLCGGCGEIKGTDSCCGEGADVCTACGLHKGSPGCCKLQKIAVDAEEYSKPAEGLEEEEPAEEKQDDIDKKVAHCGECEGDEDGDHEHEDGDKKELLSHCGECEGDEDGDHEHEDGDDKEVA